MLLFALVLLLLVANGAPIIVNKFFGQGLAQPIDGHARFIDGRPLLGPQKTIRGVLASILSTWICAILLGLDGYIGVAVGFFAMLGDIFSSFLKRRLDKPPSSRALGLDQIPESLFPMLACQYWLPLSFTDVVAVVIAFFVLSLLLSKVLYKLHIRAKPY